MQQVIDGKYEMVRLLGEGGMGAVYEARHRGTGRRVAVKVILGDAATRTPDVVERFQREARASGAIESQHVAQVLDTGVDAATGNPYMVMELLAGEDLHQVVERLGPLHPEIALRIAAQACIGLQAAHDRGIVHRDIKSANLFLALRDGGEVTVKLLDFGIAKVRADQFAQAENHGLTRTGSMLGSPLYMSPEQAKGSKSVDARSDVWSLGIALYESLAGIPPHAHCDTLGGLILAICSEVPRPIQDLAPWVSPDVAAVVHRALSIDVNGRFASAAAMHDALRALLPNGFALSSAMLTPLPATVRSVVAPRFAITPWPSAEPSSPNLPSDVVSGRFRAVTAGGGVATTMQPKRSPKWVLPTALATILVVGVGAFAAYRVVGQKKDDAAAATTTAVTAPTQPATQGGAQGATQGGETTNGAATSARTVHLAIVPLNASVDVDGVDAVVSSDGNVDITGAPGSVHHVRVKLGKRDTAGDVIIAESGAVPSKIELGVVPPPPPTGAAAVAGTKATTTTPPPQPTKAQPPPSTPGIDRAFGN